MHTHTHTPVGLPPPETITWPGGVVDLTNLPYPLSRLQPKIKISWSISTHHSMLGDSRRERSQWQSRDVRYGTSTSTLDTLNRNTREYMGTCVYCDGVTFKVIFNAIQGISHEVKPYNFSVIEGSLSYFPLWPFSNNRLLVSAKEILTFPHRGPFQIRASDSPSFSDTFPRGSWLHLSHLAGYIVGSGVNNSFPLNGLTGLKHIN